MRRACRNPQAYCRDRVPGLQPGRLPCRAHLGASRRSIYCAARRCCGCSAHPGDVPPASSGRRSVERGARGARVIRLPPAGPPVRAGVRLADRALDLARRAPPDRWRRATWAFCSSAVCVGSPCRPGHGARRQRRRPGGDPVAAGCFADAVNAVIAQRKAHGHDPALLAALPVATGHRVRAVRAHVVQRQGRRPSVHEPSWRGPLKPPKPPS